MSLNHPRDNASAVLSFSIATNDRQFDRRTGEWVQRPTVWQDLVAFGTRAEIAPDTLTRGMAVIVVGKLSHNSCTREGREPGEQDIVIRRTQLIASHIGVDLNAATAKVTKTSREADTRTEGRDRGGDRRAHPDRAALHPARPVGLARPGERPVPGNRWVPVAPVRRDRNPASADRRIAAPATSREPQPGSTPPGALIRPCLAGWAVPGG